MDLYVHINANNKPWIDMVSTEQKDEYVAVSGLMDYQKLALLNYPDKCFLDDNGVLHAPTDLPDEDVNQVKLLQEKVSEMQGKINGLTSDLSSATQDNQVKATQVKNLQNQVAQMLLKIAQLNKSAQAQTTTTVQGGNK